MPAPLTNPQLSDNLVLSAMLLYAEQSVEYQVKHPMTANNDPIVLQRQLQHYQVVLARYRKKRELNKQERQSRGYLKHEIRRINAAIYPTTINRVKYYPLVNATLNWFVGRYRNYRQHNGRLSRYQHNVAVEINAANLSEVMTRQGFTQSLEGPLKRHMAHDLSEITLSYYDIKAPETEFTLKFRKAPDSYAYYFQSFDATHHPHWKIGSTSDESPQTISVSLLDEYALDAAKASRLAAGRPVEAEIDGKRTWLIYDADSPTGFKASSVDLTRLLDRYPIKEFQDDSSKNALMNSLKQGLDPPVTLLTGPDRQLSARVSLSSDLGYLNFRDQTTGLLDIERILNEGHPAETMVKTIQTAKAAIHNSRTPRLTLA